MRALIIFGCSNKSSDLQYIDGIIQEFPKLMNCDLAYIPFSPVLNINNYNLTSFKNVFIIEKNINKERKYQRKFGGLYKVISCLLNLDYYRNGEFKLNNYDYIICIGINAVSYYIFKKRKNEGEKMLLIMADPIFLALTNYKDRYKNPFKLILKRFEEKIFLCADKVVFGSEVLYNMQNRLYDNINLKNKSSYFHLPYYTKNEANIKLEYPIKIGYFGSYSKNVRNIMPFYNICKLFPHFQFYIVGNSDISLPELPNLIQIKRLEINECKRIEASMHILISIGNLAGGQIPGKTFYFSNYIKPIIYINDKHSDFSDEIEEYLLKFNRFIITNNNEKSIKLALQDAVKLLNNNYEKLEKLSNIEIYLSPKSMCESIFKVIE